MFATSYMQPQSITLLQGSPQQARVILLSAFDISQGVARPIPTRNGADQLAAGGPASLWNSTATLRASYYSSLDSDVRNSFFSNSLKRAQAHQFGSQLLVSSRATDECRPLTRRMLLPDAQRTSTAVDPQRLEYKNLASFVSSQPHYSSSFATKSFVTINNLVELPSTSTFAT
ncbi:hypothetical protein PGT21_004708 [Puccinia graminis f. sp. tritici]|uniref:Uncharacterized protein n=1 Tax=Puccinia graminis f. sp. tritici TaxID=56615 RepID=A0A5B0N318_PUCGR|nr:hypothetical protein PGT21_004708 [Puccinia graminis f. sp. tritici]